MHQIGHYTHTTIKVQAISSSKPSPLITSPDGSLRVPSCSQASSDLVSGRRVPTKRSNIVRYASSYLSQSIGVNEVFAKEGWNKVLKISPSWCRLYLILLQGTQLKDQYPHNGCQLTVLAYCETLNKKTITDLIQGFGEKKRDNTKAMGHNNPSVVS